MSNKRLDNLASQGMKSQIYAPYRAVGFISNHIPFDVSVKGSEHFVTTVIGTAFHEYSVSEMTLFSFRFV